MLTPSVTAPTPVLRTRNRKSWHFAFWFLYSVTLQVHRSGHAWNSKVFACPLTHTIKRVRGTPKFTAVSTETVHPFCCPCWSVLTPGPNTLMCWAPLWTPLVILLSNHECKTIGYFSLSSEMRIIWRTIKNCKIYKHVYKLYIICKQT